MPIHIVLIQVREPGSAMAEHELACIQRRLTPRDINLHVENALATGLNASVLNDADALIIGGSGNFSVHHPLSQRWVTPLREVMERALTETLPSFGICFGHQLLGHHLGAPVVTAEAHSEMGTIPMRLTEQGSRDSLFNQLGEDFYAHTGHSDCVTDIPAGVDLLAKSDRLDTQAFRVRGTLFFTAQFHPDMTGSEAVSRYEAFRAGLPDPTAHAHGSTRFKADHDMSARLLGGFVDLVTQHRRGDSPQ